MTNSSSSSFIIMAETLKDAKLAKEFIDNTSYCDTESDSEIFTVNEYLAKAEKEPYEMDDCYLDDNISSLKSKKNMKYKFFFNADISYHDETTKEVLKKMGIGCEYLWS